MSDLQSLHTQARKLILMLSAGVERLESAEQVRGLPPRSDAVGTSSLLASAHHAAFFAPMQSTRPAVPDGFAADLQKQLAQLQASWFIIVKALPAPTEFLISHASPAATLPYHLLQKISIDMDGLWRMQMLREAASKRDIWKRKVEQVAEEADALRTALDKCSAKQHRRRLEDEQRQELLQRRADGRPAIDLGAEVAARRHVTNSRQVAEEAYQTGVSVLTAMSGQRDTLKNAHRKVLDVLNAVGLSDSVLRLAERRIAVDKLIAYGGMLGVTILLIVLYWWLKT